MNYDDDPIRLSERGADAPEGVRELIEHAKADVPSDHQVEKVAVALAPLLWPTATAAGATGAVAAGTVAKVVAGVALAGAVAGGGVWLASSGNESPAPAPQPPIVASAQAVEPTAVEPAPPASEESAEPEAEESASAVPDTESAESRGTVAKRGGPSEAQLLQSAQAALRTNPAQALALAREHQRRFPNGVLAQEREVIAIEALSRLGKDGEARGRADHFKQRYPGSAHDRKVDTVTDR